MQQQGNWTGERLETHISNETMLEHLHRYAAAIPFVKDKTVLDIACGEGYGCHLLSATATNVTGIDIAQSCIEKAAIKYKNPAIEFRTGSISSIPAGHASFDIITCFETLEHVEEQEKAMEELKRVLKPGGLLIISTPDKANYSDRTGYRNPFHKKELYPDEFRTLVKKYFACTVFCTQRSVAASLIRSEQPGSAEFYTGSFERIEAGSAGEPVYWIALASDIEFPAPSTSVFLDSRNVTAMLAAQEQMLKKTITYRTGHTLLAPFKFLRSLFKR